MVESVLALCIIGLPLFRWWQTELARMIPFIGITVLLSICIFVQAMNTPMQFIYDQATIAMICFALWLGASLMWTDSHQSVWEFQAWMSYLVICYISRYCDSMILLPVIMVTGVGFAVMSVFYMAKLKLSGENPGSNIDMKNKWLPRIWFIFGNQVHNSAILIIPLFISIWAGMNINPLWFLATVVMGLNIIMCKGVGAYIGIFVGILTFLFMMKLYLLMGVFIVLTVILFTIYLSRNYNHKRLKSLNIRLVYLYIVGMLLKKRYLFGYGLNMFKKLSPEINPILFENKRLRGWIDKFSTTADANTGHRPHNDLADIALELGILGLVVFGFIFYFIPWGSVDPVFIGAFIAYAIMSLFFFPLREVHTAIGFWIFTGILMGMGETVLIDIPQVLCFVIILLLIRVLYGVIIKFAGLYFFNLVQTTENGRAKNIRMAIGCDPYNAQYLMYGFITHVEKEPEIAFEYAARQLYHYDGGLVKWGVYDQFARALLRTPNIIYAEMFAEKAMRLCHDFAESKELLQFIGKIKEQIKVKED
jgi:hypothetical protein